ncbi:GfV-B61-ORF1 [Ichnoviriform fumiferanae]|uniref:GfV-B61-ORF1 n=1 Tax=Ichnoviriform fumiferanae TaxID=419435 RepID=A2PZV7_9VIRU|nr:GfV-B61-ORF1 [Ichnoviriform fumiferanae]BAF45529.1 GfV-B61-ORF1 [Ichnoviriform fumiferanae]
MENLEHAVLPSQRLCRCSRDIDQLNDCKMPIYSDVANAVGPVNEPTHYTVPRYSSSEIIIASEAPTNGNRDGFYDMLWHSGCHFIVVLEDIDENGNQKFNLYWPINQNSSRESENWLVKPLRIFRWAEHTKYHFILIRKNIPHASRLVTLFHYTKWPEHGVPKDLIELSRFITIVKLETDAARCEVNGVVEPVIVHGSFDIHHAIAYSIIDYCMNEYGDTGYFSVARAAVRLTAICNQWSFSEPQHRFMHNVVSHFIELFYCMLETPL